MQLTTNQLTARELLSRFLGMASGGAADYVLTLEDAETAELAAAAPQRPGEADTARQNLKAIVARANERRGANEERDGIPLATAAAARNGARELLQLHLGLSADEAALQEGKLTPEQRESLGELALQRRYAMANWQNDPVPGATVRQIAGVELQPALATAPAAVAVDAIGGGADAQPPAADDASRGPDKTEPAKGEVDALSGDP